MAALKALVIFMGVLIIAGMGTLAYLLTTRMAATKEPPFNRAMTIPAGTAVQGMVGVGDRLVLRIGGPAMQTRLLMIDAVHGTLLGTLDVVPMGGPPGAVPPADKTAAPTEEQ